MKILVINSDSVRNRGDRAILMGNIKLIRSQWPEAEIWSLSEFYKRDESWFGIHFLPLPVFTLNPWHFLRLGAFARQCDLVFWGGGEILKDYTNKLSLVYWAAKILSVRLFNRNIYGAFQGVGPTESPSGRWLIRWMVNQTQVFFVRDEKSKQQLIRWGVKTDIIASYDPAILSHPNPIDETRLDVLAEKAGIDKEDLRKCVGVGVRRWFHYKPHGWLPFRWKQRLTPWKKRGGLQASIMEQNIAALCDWLVETLDVHILFFPMHLGEEEDDAGAAANIMSAMRHKERVSCVVKDTLSPQEYVDLTSVCFFFIGIRLHSCILATSAGVPSLLYYYSEKGRRYFEQIGMEYFLLPIKELTSEHFLKTAQEKIDLLVKNTEKIKIALRARIDKMRSKLQSDFREVFRNQQGKWSFY